MKDSLMTLLMRFFEKTLLQQTGEPMMGSESTLDSEMQKIIGFNFAQPKPQSIRVFTPDEQARFTKGSYQFIMRLLLSGIVSSDKMESIINQLLFSEARYVTLQETKWAIRTALGKNLSTPQLAFLDLVLYQKEDELTQH